MREFRAQIAQPTLEKAAYAASCVRRAAWHVPDNRHLSCDAVRICPCHALRRLTAVNSMHRPRRSQMECNVEHATCQTTHLGTHESWRAQRRYAASIGALMAQNLNISTENSKLAVENSPLAVQGSAGMTATATSDALLQDGSGWQCTHAHTAACPRPSPDARSARLAPTCKYSEYPV
jgi:hypothetical protein